MRKNLLFLPVFLILLFSCKNDDDDETGCDIPNALVDCAAPITHTGFNIFFLDKETNENSFVSGSLTLDDIIVTDINNNVMEKEIKEIVLHSSDLPFRSHFLVIHDDFKSGENTYKFKVKNLEFNVVLDVIVYTTGCCLGSYMDNLQIEGTDHNLEHSIYLPIIYID